MKITVDASLRSRLQGLQFRLELIDETGKTLAYLTPAVDPVLYEGIEPPATEEELDRRSREGGGRPLAAILRGLEGRE